MRRALVLIGAGSALILAGVAWAAEVEDEPPGAIAEYLAFINLAVGIFNMLPGYPLDGGRVLRAALWARRGNLLAATRTAAGAGSMLAFGLMALGVVWIIVGQFASGAWFIVIGWFLRNVSESSYRQLLFQSTLGGTTVGEVVNRSFQAVPPDIPLLQMVNDNMLGKGQRCVPIVAGEELLGLVTIADLKRVPQEQWGTTSTYRAMTPKERLHVASPRDDVAKALDISRQRVSDIASGREPVCGEEPCDSLLTQVLAVHAAVEQVGLIIMELHLRRCLLGDLGLDEERMRDLRESLKLWSRLS